MQSYATLSRWCRPRFDRSFPACRIEHVRACFARIRRPHGGVPKGTAAVRGGDKRAAACRGLRVRQNFKPILTKKELTPKLSPTWPS